MDTTTKGPDATSTGADGALMVKPPVEGLVRIDADAGFGSAAGFALLQRGATLLANSTLVPKEYQGNIPNCTIALNMAQRIGADPLMVMQNLYIVHGRPGWSSQFLIATFNQCGRFSAIRYEWEGEPGTDGRGCRAWAIEKETGAKLSGALITIALAKAEGWYQKAGSKWQTMPEQMTMYRSAAWFVRAYAPEIAMGLHTADEIDDAIIEATATRVEPVVATPASLSILGAVTADTVVGGSVTGQDAPDDDEAAPPPPPATEPLAGPKPAAESVRARLEEIAKETDARGVKPAIRDHLMKKHVGTTDMSTMPHDDETWAKLGRVLQEIRSIPAAKK